MPQLCNITCNGDRDSYNAMKAEQAKTTCNEERRKLREFCANNASEILNGKYGSDT
jgi:hypothetical protein